MSKFLHGNKTEQYKQSSIKQEHMNNILNSENFDSIFKTVIDIAIGDSPRLVDTNYTNCYFMGRTLVIDYLIDNKLRCITLSWETETVGLFDGGTRRLLSLQSLRLLRLAMQDTDIRFADKLWI